jgi:hypothetical protein
MNARWLLAIRPEGGADIGRGLHVCRIAVRSGDVGMLVDKPITRSTEQLWPLAPLAFRPSASQEEAERESECDYPIDR